MKLSVPIIVVLMLCGAVFGAETGNGVPRPQEGGRDCTACHAQAAGILAASGGKHNNASGCTYCHKGHPPEVSNAIPLCSQCHSGKPHYQQPDCKKCHVSAHAPLLINFLVDCQKCHAEITEKLSQKVTKHSSLGCTACHVSRISKPHGFLPECLSCHKPHDVGQTTADCKVCHDPHMPKILSFKTDTPSKGCGVCHKKPYELLMANKTKHHNLVCAACHQGRHKTVPKCQACHGLPHSAKGDEQFDNCAKCHNTAHDLSIP